MSRYIDADALIVELNKRHIPYNVRINKAIMDAPTIEIVRCRECKYFIDNLTEDDTDEAYDSCRWDWSRKIPTADDFCSYGEKQTEGSE